MSHIKVFLDTSVLLTSFGGARNGVSHSYILSADHVDKVTFEKCVFESFLAFRGVGGNKPDEGRQDWARRFLKREGDPIPLAEAAGKLHLGSFHAAHYWVGQADEAQWAMPETFDAYMADIKKFVREEDWQRAAEDWDGLQRILANHHCYQALFREFKVFLAEHRVAVVTYEESYNSSNQTSRYMAMEGLSQRSCIPNEDFEIVVAALLIEPDVFVSTDRRLLVATASIEGNLRRCDFVHLEDVKEYVEASCK